MTSERANASVLMRSTTERSTASCGSSVTEVHRTRRPARRTAGERRMCWTPGKPTTAPPKLQRRLTPDGIARFLELRLFLVHPLLEFLGVQDGHEAAHPVVAQAAELRAGDLVLEVGIARPGAHLLGGD